MKYPAHLLVLTILYMLLACGGQNGTVEETKEEFLVGVENKLLKIQGEIVALRERADQPLTRDKAKFNAQIDTLGMIQDQAQKKLAGLKESDADLQKMKSELEPLLQELQERYEWTRDW